jgi:hypothetical protein
VKLQAQLETSENFGDIFEIVKKSVKQQMGMERAGLMLVLADLPMHLGAFHGVGSNQIVMNRALLDRIVAAGHPRIRVNAFVYSILLHEYLHSLGVIDEAEVRRLVNEISLKTFGPNHPAAEIAARGPWSLIREHGFVDTGVAQGPEVDMKQRRVELITDFDRSDRNYIS